ncbi:hypothetical protein [Paenibacillus sp. MMS20-IR301]|uniref:hypothetical protein n=1 Tax=Paenibacillus sp. MMS20-IR301 TaxID=2895946 RepID=UPI0028E8EA54|nr:hypothetical protein [Paenibacillus sp. MMS20-IR301]WNS43555.1 hypothetical protein LOS79_32240 [Paenibacillus sp. MMS20-IR301]
MYKSVRVLWISAVVVNISSFIFYFLSTYHWFSEGLVLDIINTLLLQLFGIPSAVLIIASLCILIFNRKPAGWAVYTVALLIIAALLLISGYLILLGSLGY